MPGRTGTVAGLFFGFAFGMGGIGAAVLGKVADSFGINLVYEICAFLPIIGLLAGFLPDVDSTRRRQAARPENHGLVAGHLRPAAPAPGRSSGCPWSAGAGRTSSRNRLFGW